MAAVCDGAITDDAAGFNAFDTGFGHTLASRDENDWTPNMLVVAYKMLRKYREQLLRLGIDYDKIPEPQSEKRRRPTRQITLCNSLIAVKFDYDPDLVEQIKEFPRHSRRYDPATKIWEITPSITIVEQLIEYATANDFDVDDDVKDLLSGIIEEHKHLLEKSRSSSSDYEITGLGGELYPFQRAGVEYAVNAERCFVADQMGLGKTITALAVLHVKNAYPALVICPATVKYNWALEILKWLPGKKVGMVKGRDFYRAQMANAGRLYTEKDDHNLPGAYDIIIMNYDILKPRPKLWECHTEYTNIKEQTFKVGDIIPEPLKGFPKHAEELVKEHFKRAGYGKSKNGLIEKLLNINLAAVIFDESHYAKSHKAQRTTGCTQVVKEIPIRLALTGTPILNRPSELISQLTILNRLNDLGGFWHFAERYCGAYHSRWGLDLSGAKNLDELNTKMRGICYIRRTKDQVMPELPPKQRSDVMFDLDNRVEYDKAKDDLVAWLKQNAKVEEEYLESISDLPDNEQHDKIADYRMSAAARAARALQLTKIEHLKQLAVKGKFNMALEWIRDFLETEEKLVVFAHHIEIQKALLNEFNGAARILSEDNSEARQNNIEKFQGNDDCRLIICSLKAGGIGITLTAASNVAFLELGWTPADHDQSEDRLHRIGQMDSVMAWYLLANDSIDIDIQELINEKREVVDAATEGEIADVSQASIMNDLIERLIK